MGAGTDRAPRGSTTGGTSDARFVRRMARGSEFGLGGQTMHRVDERAAVDGVKLLAQTYAAMLRGAAGMIQNAA